MATSTADGHAILRVANTGPTIPAAELDRLFEPFQRLDGARTSSGDGLGLGLSIVRAIADAHTATVTTTAPDDGGLSIEIAFPASQQIQPAAPGRHEIDTDNGLAAPEPGHDATSEPSETHSS